MFFFEKKNQKTFSCWHARCRSSGAARPGGASGLVMNIAPAAQFGHEGTKRAQPRLPSSWLNFLPKPGPGTP
jgi:hypothetical protein